MSFHITRRGLLLGAGGATLALPFLESIGRGRAMGQSIPPRFLVFMTHEGTILPRWMPATTGPFELSELLRPLTPMKDKLSVVSGVSNFVSDLHFTNGHNATSRTLLSAHLTATGADSSGNLIPRDSQSETGFETPSIGPSIDQALAAAIGSPQPLSVRLGNDYGETRAFFRTAPQNPSNPNGGRATVDQINDAEEAFATYVAPYAMMEGGPPVARPFRERLNLRRRNVLDGVRESLSSLRAQVSVADRHRLEAHEASIERFQSGLIAPPTMTPLTCDPTQMLPEGYSDSQRYDAQYKAQLDVLVQGLACGVSRVAGFHDPDMYDPPFPRFIQPPSAELAALGAIPFPGMESDWHSNVHGAGGGGVGDRDTNPALVAGFTFYAAMFRYLLERMDEIVEPNGATLLDNSLVMWISEFADGGAHRTTNLPIVLAGSCGGAFTTGRHIATDGGNLDIWDEGPYSTNDLYTSIHRLFGADIDRFGYDGGGFNHGGIPEIER